MVWNFRVSLGGYGFHHQGRHLGRTDVGTVAASLTIQGVDLNPETVILQVLTLSGNSPKG